MDENLTKREVMLFAREMKNGKMTPTLALFIPDIYDKGTVVTDVFDPNFTKIDNWADTINKALKELEKVATTTTAGRVIIGDGLTVDGAGKVKHATTTGFKHIPSGGAIGQYLKWLKTGEAQWADIDINLDDYYNKGEVDNKFKNFCPFPVNSLFLSLGSENPSTLWLGTTWQKQEGRFLLGSSSSYGLGSIGGASTAQLAIANLPPHTHSATTASHTHTQPVHTHSSQYSSDISAGFVKSPNKVYIGPNGASVGTTGILTTSAGGETTGSASPVTSIGSTGSGTAFSILPPYLVVNIWKRLS